MSKATQYFNADLLGAIDQLDGDSGSATETGGAVTIAGGNNITTSAAASTVTVSLDALTNGQLFIGNTGNPATAATLTAGTGINIANAAGSITVNGIGGGITWNVEAGMSASMVVNNGYISNNAGLVTFTLPVTAAVGDIIEITGLGAGLWKIGQNASQLINFIAVGSSTTTGVGGSITCIEQFASIKIVCVVANTTFNVLSSAGNFTIV